MQIAICDDDKGCCSQIEQWLIDYTLKEKADIKTELFYSAEVLLNEIKDNYWFDMIFLDIELPQATGIALGHEIRRHTGERNVSIIFISGKTKYCQELFELEPQNFHRKPLVKSDIIRDVEIAMRRIGNRRQVFHYIENRSPKGIALGEIMYMEAKNKELEITTRNHDKIVIRDSITRIAEECQDYQMCHCHRSHLVNLFYVEKYYNQTFYMKDGKEIPVGRRYLDNVKKMWASYEGGNY